MHAGRAPNDGKWTTVENIGNTVGRGVAAVAIGLVGYFALAWLLSSAAQTRPLISDHPAVPAARVEFGPDRVERERLSLHKASYEYDCNECHWDQPRDPTPREFIGEHGALQFDHGRNNECFNCHHDVLVDKLADGRGEPVEHDQHGEVCARCHGPQHRDWLAGAHGRRSGYWDKSRGEQRRTDCIICHDPHRPAFAPIQPLPPPGVAIGTPIAAPEPHGVVPQLMRIRPVPEEPTLRGPALPEDSNEAAGANR